MTVQHNPDTAHLYRILAAVLTELEEAGEVRHDFDTSNSSLNIQWDSRKRRYEYRPWKD